MKRQTKWMISSTLAMVLAGGVCSGAYAANEGNVYSLNPVVVTATRTEKTDLDTPASTDIITEKDIKETGAKTVFDAHGHYEFLLWSRRHGLRGYGQPCEYPRL